MGNQAEKYIFALIFAASKDSVAQLVEHLPFKERVLGSSPSRITTTIKKACKSNTYRLFLFTG